MLSRRTVLLLISGLGIAVLLAALVPQRVTSPDGLDALQAKAPFLVDALKAAGLDHVVSTWGFAFLLALCWLTLGLATLNMLRRDYRRTFRPRTWSGLSGWHVVGDRPGLEESMAALRYWAAGRIGDESRFLKNPWNLWGASLLHLGMLIALAFAVLTILTTARSMVVLVEGESLDATTQVVAQDYGVLASPLSLEEPLELASVTPRFWDDGSVRQLETVILLGDSAQQEQLTVSINGSRVVRGVRIYQDQRFGYSYFLTVAFPDGTELMQRADLSQPLGVGNPTYMDIPLQDGSVLRLKCVEDPGTQSMSDEPEFVLRRELDGEVVAQSTMTTDTVSLDDVTVRLDGRRRWATFVLAREWSVIPLFAGFALVFLGATALYVGVPREVRLRTDENGQTWARWNAYRFARSVDQERDALFGSDEEGSS
ncbi:MAG: cytochrome c biogenesis protein ResB [Coriobacteriia bacterium]|nr:cytochrome c biogenesis protein ResB [Coriobacteriia bacterium]MBN2822458.1 cytochrome c biogenesis protein ResB [Coriobacteriia bacterium]